MVDNKTALSLQFLKTAPHCDERSTCQKPDPKLVSTEMGLAATISLLSGRPVGGEVFLLTSPFIER
jgi:hypothetical protein